MKSNNKIIISTNSTWNLTNFRYELIKALISEGYEVLAIAPEDKYVDQLKSLGCRYLPLYIDNKGKNPLIDIFLFFKYIYIFFRERPIIYLSYTIKPNIYGSLAAHFYGINVINNVAGLGIVFSKNNILTSVVKKLYKLAFMKSKVVFFQNNDDLSDFISAGLVNPNIADRLPGSGVNLKKFKYSKVANLKKDEKKFQFLLVSRLLWEKGVGEFVVASKILKKNHTNVECCILGFLDVDNPNAISRKQMDEWVAEGGVTYLGSTDNVSSFMASADCIVLPSYYREGVPKTLLEAAAIGRPIITTNSVGCRDIVDQGVNGYLCEPKNPNDLALSMSQMVLLSDDEILSMGRKGRDKVEREFDEILVIKKYISAIRNIRDFN
jgi:glycosyltransferase involved in cell wall biosynthesis